MAICEEDAIQEIKGLSRNAKDYLGNIFRGHVQTLSGAAESHNLEILQEAAKEMKYEIEKIGL